MQTGLVDGSADITREGMADWACGRQAMLKGVQKCRSDRQCSKTVQTGRVARRYGQGRQTGSADRASAKNSRKTTYIYRALKGQFRPYCI